MNFSMFIGSRELILHLIEAKGEVKNFYLEKGFEMKCFSQVTVMILIELDHIFPPNNLKRFLLEKTFIKLVLFMVGFSVIRASR